MPVGKKPPARGRAKLPPWNLKSSTMMVRTGMAIFHQVIVLLSAP